MGQTIIPARTKAEMGMALLKEAILDHLEDHPEGVGNVELAGNLNLRSDQDGDHRNFLTYSVLGLLINANLVEKIGEGRSARYTRVTGGTLSSDPVAPMFKCRV
jgi:hypothetical protein